MAFNVAILLGIAAGTAVAQYPARAAYPPPGGSPQVSAPNTPGAGGQVMYFCKPADATAPISGSGGPVVPTAASDPTTGSPAIPAVPVAQAPTALPPAAQAPMVLPPSAPVSLPPAPPAPAAPANQMPLGFAPSAQLGSQPLTIPSPPAGPDATAANQFPLAFAPANPQAPMNPQPPAGPRTSDGMPQPKKMDPPTPPPLLYDQTISLPNRDEIFKVRNPVEVERWVMEKVKASLGGSDDASLKFPAEEKIGGDQPYRSKTASYPPQQAIIEPTYLVHRRLLFEERNAERAGWDLGFVQPLVSAAYFYKDFLLLPNSLISGCSQGFWDSNAGKCVPGTPTPYMLYPPGLTIEGGLFEGVAITGISFIIP